MAQDRYKYANPELESYVMRRRIICLAISIILWVGTFAFLIVGTSRYKVSPDDFSPILWIFVIAALLFPFYALKLHRVLAPMNVGTVEDVRVIYTVKADAMTGASRFSRRIAYTVVEVNFSGSRSVEYTYEDEAHDLIDHYYRPGDRVLRYKACKYLFDLDRKDYEICVVCGYLNDAGVGECPRCKKDIFKER